MDCFSTIKLSQLHAGFFVWSFSSMTKIQRCTWCSDDPLYQQYHDTEWGRPLYDEKKLFELLCLEGQQAGLSWITVLKKREAYRTHFFNLSIEEIAQISDQELIVKMQDASLIRHFAKLKAIRTNARAWLKLKVQVSDVSKWLWAFVYHTPQTQNITHPQSVPSYTEVSEQLAHALKKYGFQFIGKTICYAFMQASGMVNDHENLCTFK